MPYKLHLELKDHETGRALPEGSNSTLGEFVRLGFKNAYVVGYESPKVEEG